MIAVALSHRTYMQDEELATKRQNELDAENDRMLKLALDM